MASSGADNDVPRLLEFVEEEFGTLDVRMETFYSQAFLHDRFVAEIRDGHKGRLRKYEANLRYFRRILPQLLGMCLDGHECEYHAALVKSVDATDVFLSFNYDCLLDTALARNAKRRWDPGRGYGFDIDDGVEDWKNHAGMGRFPDPGIRLLKPHGSLNWERRGDLIALVREPYRRRSEGTIEIVPPLWQKDYDRAPYTSIWEAARRVLSASKALFVIGYSLPETDVYTQAMLRIDVGELDFLCLVNPDTAARSRIKNVLRSALTSRTHLVELDYLEDLAALLGDSESVLTEVASNDD